VSQKLIIYETTNLVNGKKYRGAHICNDLNDGYLGSGKLLLEAILKYGFDSFQRSILYEAKTIAELYEAEARFVNAEWVADPNTYNLKIGGEGGWDYINKKGLRWNEEKKRLHSIEMKKKRLSGDWGPKGLPMLGKRFSHSEEAKKKISENSSSRLQADEIEKRLKDLIIVNFPKRGSIKKLSELWKVSHTQVRRFIKEHTSK
jgi:hypothetical protein